MIVSPLNGVIPLINGLNTYESWDDPPSKVPRSTSRNLGVLVGCPVGRMARVAKTQKNRANATAGEVDALNSAFKAEFQGKAQKELTGGGTKKPKKANPQREPKEETAEEKCLKSCNTAVKAVVRHQGQLLVAISQLNGSKVIGCPWVSYNPRVSPFMSRLETIY